jgi:hypothetical protein
VVINLKRQRHNGLLASPDAAHLLR